MPYYITRSNPSQKWRVKTSKGPLTHADTFETLESASEVRDVFNAAIEAERKFSTSPVGRPSLPEDEKAKRVFFTLRPEVWKAISPGGNAKELKTFAKAAIREKLDRDGK